LEQPKRNIQLLKQAAFAIYFSAGVVIDGREAL
jgi:hypothetical protein